ncbi:fumarate/nitrate reduction transcriptional regulator Fnr [Elongatibacter sediminis]|uniref:Fumarate/nitrate reduction transcriptional regulator Fnr n=1 Tax=Elongatibacter sediminis TaxID=3119006 RepID=A0AAW9RED7_9GAMM
MECSAANINIREFRRDASRSQVACSRCSLGELCLPRGLDPDEVQRFEKIVNRSRPLRAGEHLFRAGDEFRSVASVRTGCFKSYVVDAEGQEQVLGFHLPGEIIGLDAIHSCRHTASVVALDTSAVCTLSFESVTQMARSMPELQAELFRIMSARISELETIAGDLSADERIAMFLLSLSDRFSRRGYSEHEFILAMSRRDIASFLRLATETVSRVLARLQKSGLLKVDRKQVRIRDLDALREVARQQAA